MIAALVAVLALSFLALRFTDRVTALLGVTGANVVGRVSGVILAALAAQFMLDGLAQGLPRLGIGWRSPELRRTKNCVGERAQDVPIPMRPGCFHTCCNSATELGNR